jgi:hypothetical protein
VRNARRTVVQQGKPCLYEPETYELYALLVLICICLLSGRLCDLVVRGLGYITELYCASCEVRTEFMYVM